MCKRAMLKRIRFIIAMAVAKLALLLLKILKRTASYTPGLIALKICPAFLGGLTMPETVICVTGTNGKTTTSNLLAGTLRACGYSVTNNSAGSNVQAGIATALLHDSTLGGKPKKQIAVLEVDERSSIRVYSYITPDYLICNNIMRDSLKRNAHTDFIVYVINKALSSSTHVILNADDLICCSIAPDNKKKTFFGVEACQPDEWNLYAPRDIVYCPKCGERLGAEYIRYNHIGRFFCPKCHLTSPKRDYTVVDINYGENEFTIEHDSKDETFRLINDNIVNVYNCCGAIALLSEFGLSYEQIKSALETQKIVKTRFDSFTAGRLNITMQLAKGQNPIACARAYNYVVNHPAEKKSLLILVDDYGDNNGDSESVCWIYDCDYSALTHDSVGEIVFSGPRCYDQRMRAIVAGVDESKIKLCESFTDGVKLVNTDKYSDIFVLYDPYLLSQANIIKRELIARGGTK